MVHIQFYSLGMSMLVSFRIFKILNTFEAIRLSFKKYFSVLVSFLAVLWFGSLYFKYTVKDLHIIRSKFHYSYAVKKM